MGDILPQPRRKAWLAGIIVKQGEPKLGVESGIQPRAGSSMTREYTDESSKHHGYADDR
jgi:hypothetical protein